MNEGAQNPLNAAARFYSESHFQRQKKFSPEEVELDASRNRVAVTRPGHRYSCIYSYLQTHTGLNVVELGFGFTALLPVLASSACKYTIVDIVDRREGAQLPTNVQFERADLNEDFPFSNASFDVTIAMMVVEHLFDPFHSFRELARITKPRGKVFVNLPNVGSLRCRLQLALGRMPNTSSSDWFEKREWDGNHLHYFTIHDVERLASLYGLVLQDVYPVGNLQWLKSLIPSLFCHEISFVFEVQ